MSEVSLPAILLGIISVSAIAGKLQKHCYFITTKLVKTLKNYRKSIFSVEFITLNPNFSSIFVLFPSKHAVIVNKR